MELLHRENIYHMTTVDMIVLVLEAVRMMSLSILHMISECKEVMSQLLIAGEECHTWESIPLKCVLWVTISTKKVKPRPFLSSDLSASLQFVQAKIYQNLVWLPSYNPVLVDVSKGYFIHQSSLPNKQNLSATVSLIIRQMS